MQMIAKFDGFYGGRRIRKGETFEFKGGKPGSWMIPVEAEAPVKPKSRKSAPETFSEIAKQDAADGLV